MEKLFEDLQKYLVVGILKKIRIWNSTTLVVIIPNSSWQLTKLELSQFGMCVLFQIESTLT